MSTNKQTVPKIRFEGLNEPYKSIKMLEMAENRKFSNGVFNDPAKVGRGYKLINVINMYEIPYISYEKLTLLDLSEDEFLKNKAVKGDIFFTRSSLVKEGIAWNNVYLEDHEDVTFDGHLIKLTLDQYKFKPIYFHYNFRSHFVRKQIISVSKTGSMTTIGQADLAGIKVYYPLMQEQTQIGNFFQQLDKLIELQTRAVESAETYKKVMLQKMFPQKGEKVPRVRFEGFSGNWERELLGDLMDVTSVRRIHQADWTEEGVRFLRARDIVAFKNRVEVTEPLYISNERYEEYSKTTGKVEVGHLLVTGVGTIGVSMLIENDNPLYFKDGNVIWFKNNILNGYFFNHSFSGVVIQNFIKINAGTGTVGTYTIDSGKKTPIKFPSLEEQTKIGAFFQKLDQNIEVERQKLEKYQGMKKAMLQRMFV